MEKQGGNRKKVIGAFAVFLVLMWIFTLVSKSIYVSRLPEVSVDAPTRKYVEHTVETEGMVIQGGEQAVTALEGLRVKQIFVRAGDKVEEGMPLFQVDLEDLKEFIREKELAVTKLQYQISDLKANQALEEQKKQIAQQRAREDYGEKDSTTGTGVSRAEETKNKADSSLENHLNSQVSITSEEDRRRAWEEYEKWKNRQQELFEEIEYLKRVITDLESTPEGEGRELTEDEKKELEKRKKELQDYRDLLAQHESNAVREPDFSQEDSALENWKDAKNQLEERIEGAKDSIEDAYANRESALKDAGRIIEDALFPGQADSTLKIHEMDLDNLKRQLEKYRKILNNEGNITAESAGIVTDVQISVGGRIPGTAAMLLTDDNVPCVFKANLNKEQKKYVNLGDKMDLKLAGKGLDSLETEVNYVKESEGSPGNYEVYGDLPEGAGVPGLSGTLSTTVTGQLHDLCIPVEALYSENKKYYVYVVKEREGILGRELYVDKAWIEVIDQNDKLAAISPGAVTKDTEVITYSSEEIKRGDVVKYQEN